MEKTKTAKLRPEKGKSLITFPNDYVVIDIETTGLHPKWDDIIEIGAVKVVDKIIQDEFCTLIKPHFSIPEFITQLTGIWDEMVCDAPNIENVLPDLFDFVQDNLLVAHNANFDINFIYDHSVNYLNTPLTNNFIDTWRLSRLLFPEMENHKLQTLRREFNIVTNRCHRALDDCLATQQCFEYIKEFARNNRADLFGLTTHQKILMSEIAATVDISLLDENCFTEKKFVFTGALKSMERKDAMQAVVNLGGKIASSVSKCTDYLVDADNYESGKNKKAKELNLNGAHIQVINEEEFLQMLKSVEID